MKYKWLLFDADGTLFDFEKAELFALKKTLKYFKINYSSTLHKRYNKINYELFSRLEQGFITSNELKTKRFEFLLSEFNINLDSDTVSKTYLSNLSKGCMLIPGAIDTIRTLHPEFKMFIVTNGFLEVQKPRFENSGISQYFIDILISDEIGVAKPAKEFFDVIYSKIGKPNKSEIMIIGDSLTSDMAGGINFGIDTCWFNPHQMENKNNLNVSYEINELHELIKIVKNI
ncbi:MAG TPA: YjjG family noncanonical pyrimidine nucleotidase [Victivallales bacterium]|nr:YjjG family noncanonical pyrimidine nucleotidase [Victivallales bacterium]